MNEDEMVDAAPLIQKMMETPAWALYCKLVQAKIEIVKGLLVDTTAEELPFHQGSIKGMLAAVASANDLISEVRTTTGEKKDAQRRRLFAAGPRANFD